MQIANAVARRGETLPALLTRTHKWNGVLLESNDNWVESANKQAIIESTILPGDPKESVIVRTLAP